MPPQKRATSQSSKSSVNEDDETAAAEGQEQSVQEAPPTPEVVSVDEPKISAASLIEHSEQWLGQPSFVVAGALNSDDRDELTVTEARERVESWLG